MAAHGLISRPTEDLDLFSPTEGAPGQVSAALQAELTVAGFRVVEVDAADQHAGKFRSHTPSAGSA